MNHAFPTRRSAGLRRRHARADALRAFGQGARYAKHLALRIDRIDDIAPLQMRAERAVTGKRRRQLAPGATFGGPETDIAVGDALRQFGKARADGLGRHGYIAPERGRGAPADAACLFSSPFGPIPTP